MGYGLSAENATTGELTISSDGITYSYVGQATLASVTQATTTGTNRFAGYSTYTIDWAAGIVPAIPLRTDGRSKLVSMSQAGSTWTITVHNGDGSLNTDGFENQVSCVVHVFGAPVSVSGYGLALYGAAGQLVADLSRAPLAIKTRIALAAGVTSIAMPSGMTTPAIIGWPFDEKDTTSGSGITIENKFRSRGWRWDTSGGLLVREPYLDNLENHTDHATAVQDTINTVGAFLIEASGL